MERLGILIGKLQVQYEERLPLPQMMMTIQMIQQELELAAASQPVTENRSKVSVVLPSSLPVRHPFVPEAIPQQETKVSVPKDEPAPVYHVLPDTEEEESAEKTPEPVAVSQPAPTPNPVAQKPTPSVQQPVINHEPAVRTYDPLVEVPTLSHQKEVLELNDTVAKVESLNEKLRSPQTDLVSRLGDTPVKDLRKAIGINDRFVFINELFRGDESMYERSLKTINGFHIFPEAEYWMERELKIKLGWDDNAAVVQQFYQVVRRRFA